MTISKAELHDVRPVVDLGFKMYSESPTYSQFKWEFDYAANFIFRCATEDDRLLLVYKNCEEVVGFLAATTSTHFFGPSKMAIEQLFYIHPDHRGGRSAIKMLRMFESWAKDQGCEVINFGQTSEGVDDRWDKFCENLGYYPIGKVFYRNL